MQLRLLLFSARLTVRDALLGFPIGSAVRLEYPNGSERRQALGAGRRADLTSLPRGDYRVSVDALGISSSRPVALSRDQEVRLQVISWLDVAIVLLGLGVDRPGAPVRAAPGGRPRAARRPPHATCCVALVLAHRSAARGSGGDAARPAVRLLLHLVQRRLLEPGQDRLSAARPLFERRPRRDARHVDWAKQAGIDGFIVSWKSTPVLNRRLERLAEVADAEHFKLLVIYQGLDFQREPLPASRVARTSISSRAASPDAGRLRSSTSRS